MFGNATAAKLFFLTEETGMWSVERSAVKGIKIEEVSSLSLSRLAFFLPHSGFGESGCWVVRLRFHDRFLFLLFRGA